MTNNRHHRRATIAAQGTPWRKHRASVKFVEQARAMEAKGLKMTPDQAREALGRWAAVGGQIPVAEVERAEEAAGLTLGGMKR